MFSELSLVGKIIQHDLVLHDNEPHEHVHHHQKKILLEALQRPIHDTKSEQGKLQFNSLLGEKQLFLQFVERSKRIDEIVIIKSSSSDGDENINNNHKHLHHQDHEEQQHHHGEENNINLNHHHFFRLANIEKVELVGDKIPKTSDYEPLSWACFGKCKKSRIEFLSRITSQDSFEATRLEQDFMGQDVFMGFSDFGIDDSQDLEKNKNLLHICYKSHVHHGFLLVIDTLDVSENYILNELPLWVQDLRSVVSDSVPIVLIGNNADKRDSILLTQHKLEEKLPLSREQGEKLAEKLGCFTYIEMENDLSMDSLRKLLVKIHIIHKDLTFCK